MGNVYENFASISSDGEHFFAAFNVFFLLLLLLLSLLFFFCRKAEIPRSMLKRKPKNRLFFGAADTLVKVQGINTERLRHYYS